LPPARLGSLPARLAKLIWKIASPKWRFDDATFDRTAVAFNNPDYVAIAILNYQPRRPLPKRSSRLAVIRQTNLHCGIWS
jgi:hypothetical protein